MITQIFSVYKQHRNPIPVLLDRSFNPQESKILPKSIRERSNPQVSLHWFIIVMGN